MDKRMLSHKSMLTKRQKQITLTQIFQPSFAKKTPVKRGKRQVQYSRL